MEGGYRLGAGTEKGEKTLEEAHPVEEMERVAAWSWQVVGLLKPLIRWQRKQEGVLASSTVPLLILLCSGSFGGTETYVLLVRKRTLVGILLGIETKVIKFTFTLSPQNQDKTTSRQLIETTTKHHQTNKLNL
jgi:hypothetical protein